MPIFVQGLNVFDEKGAPVPTTPAGRSAWKLDIKTPAMVRLQYDVRIDHDKVDWDVSSAFGRGYTLDNIVFFVGRVLFITPPRFSERIEVEYKLPEGWEVATALESLQPRRNTFEAASIRQLLHNGNLVGKIVRKEIHVGELSVEIAAPSSLAGAVSLFHDSMERIIKAYLAQMGGTPKGKLVIVAAMSSSLFPGGEAFPNSISLMLGTMPNASNKSYWGYLLSHEIYHLWNGHSIRPAKQQEVEWFVEGFTQYMSQFTAFKTGFTSRSDFDDELARSKYSYETDAGKISLLAAGSEKGRNFRLIYNGGMVVASALDQEIRKATKTKGLEDFMRAMYEKFGQTGNEYTFGDIVQTATAVAGKDMTRFFRDYVAGTRVLSVK